MRWPSFLSVQMLFLVLAALGQSETPVEHCAQFTNADCNYCLEGIENGTTRWPCGYCLDDRRCVPGDASGPFQGKCNVWIMDKTDAKCIEDSYIGFSTPVRIIIGVCVAVIASATIIFMIWIFPMFFKAEPGADAVSVEF